MRLVCAWCGNTMRTSRAGGKGDISYGICMPCVNGVLSNTPGLMKEYIDRIDSPVALVNGEGVVMTANSRACALLHKELAQIEGVSCGAVFGCAHAGKAAGCGSVNDCAGCEIRRCVTHTHRTGRRLSKVAAHLARSGQAPEDVSWLISTSKFLDCVVLRISGSARVRKTRQAAPSAPPPAPPDHASVRENRGTSTPSTSTISQNIPSGLTHRPPSP